MNILKKYLFLCILFVWRKVILICNIFDKYRDKIKKMQNKKNKKKNKKKKKKKKNKNNKIKKKKNKNNKNKLKKRGKSFQRIVRNPALNSEGYVWSMLPNPKEMKVQIPNYK